MAADVCDDRFNASVSSRRVTELATRESRRSLLRQWILVGAVSIWLWRAAGVVD